MNNANTLIARNLQNVAVGDTLVVKSGQVFKEGTLVSFDLTNRVAKDGTYTVLRKEGKAPGSVGYYSV